MGPRTTHRRKVDRFSRPPGVRAKVYDVIDVDIVTADRQGIKTVAETMSHLHEHALNRQSEVQCGSADGIEASAFGGRSGT